jgi:choline-sulfatase
VLDALKQNGLEEDTLVVYLGDNGYSLGQHGRFEKHCCYEPAIRCPLIMRLPGRIRRGVVTDFAEFVDVAPTVLDLTGAEPLPLQHGRSLRPYLEGRKPASPRDHIFTEYLENEEACVRTAKRKSICCSGRRRRGDGYETDRPTSALLRLYDVERDLDEFTDPRRRAGCVAASGAHARPLPQDASEASRSRPEPMSRRRSIIPPSRDEAAG